MFDMCEIHVGLRLSFLFESDSTHLLLNNNNADSNSNAANDNSTDVDDDNDDDDDTYKTKEKNNNKLRTMNTNKGEYIASFDRLMPSVNSWESTKYKRIILQTDIIT